MKKLAKKLFLSGIMKRSQNYLPLTGREKVMVNWFIKFILATILLIACWILPVIELNGHIGYVRALEAQASQIEEKTQTTPELSATVEDIEVYEVLDQAIRTVTAYNVGDPYQTDDTPCIGAYTKVNLCEELEKGVNVCAANFVPLGTELLLEGKNGWSFHCIVWDRMNKRYPNRVDIAMKLSEKQRAKNFSTQNLSVKILK